MGELAAGIGFALPCPSPGLGPGLRRSSRLTANWRAIERHFHPILDFGEGVAGTCFIKVAAPTR